MKRFLLHLVVPTALALLLLAAAAEALLRHSPNEMRYKSQRLDADAGRLRVLVLGSSSVDRGIIPSRLGCGPALSCASQSQDLRCDEWILLSHIDRMDSLRLVVLDLNYGSLYLDIGRGDAFEALRPKYRIYWHDPRFEARPCQYPELGRFNWIDWTGTLVNPDTIHADGFMSRPYEAYDSAQWVDYSRRTAASHTGLHRPEALEVRRANIQALSHMAQACLERHVEVLLVTTPVHPFFAACLDSTQLADMQAVADSLCASYPNLHHANHLRDTHFTAADMNNANHLNHRGATRLTALLAASLDTILRP